MFRFKTENDLKERARITDLEENVGELKQLIKNERKLMDKYDSIKKKEVKDI